MPYAPGIIVSSLVRNILAKTGEAPPVDTDTVISPLSSMDGKIKSHISGLSTTFTRILFLFASRAIDLFNFSLFVAAITNEYFLSKY